MKKILIVVGAIVLLAVVVTLSVKGASRKGVKVYEEEAKKADSLVSTVKASGEIQPKVYVNISSQVPGEIVDLKIKEGDRVRKGDVLLQLDPEQYRSNVARLEANVKRARIDLDREHASLATYQSTLRRQEALAKDLIVSPETLDQSRLQAETSRIQILGLEEQIRQADADLVKARDELAKTTIKAPMDGLVTKVNAKLGEQVIIGTMNNPGTSILVLSDMSEMLAEVRVDETEVTQLKAGQKATVLVDALEGRKFEGSVADIAHTAVKENNVSRFTVKVSLSGEAASSGQPATRELPISVETGSGSVMSALRPGMSAHAAIQVASKSGALVVPLQAVIGKKRREVEEALQKAASPGGGGSGSGKAAEAKSGSGEGSIAAEKGQEKKGPAEPQFADEDVDILFVDRNGKAELMRVTSGLSDEFNLEILGAALQAGDRVVVGPYRTLKKLKPGDALVRVEKDEDLKEKE